MPFEILRGPGVVLGWSLGVHGKGRGYPWGDLGRLLGIPGFAGRGELGGAMWASFYVPGSSGTVEKPLVFISSFANRKGQGVPWTVPGGVWGVCGPLEAAGRPLRDQLGLLEKSKASRRGSLEGL